VDSTITPSSSRGLARWPDMGTPDQRSELYSENLDHAGHLQRRIDDASDWAATYEVSVAIERARGALPDWLVDGLLEQTACVLNVPVIGTAEQWLEIPLRDRNLVNILYHKIQSGAVPPDTRVSHHHWIMTRLQGPDRRLPAWARDRLLMLLSDKVSSEDTASRDHIASDATSEGDLDDDCVLECDAVSDGYQGRDDLSTGSDDPVAADACDDELHGQRAADATPAIWAAGKTRGAERFRAKSPWPDGVWGLPNAFARTALASSTKGDPGDYGPAPVRVPSLSHTRLVAHGSRITQGDLNPFLMCMHIARYSDEIELTPSEFLKGMHQGTSTRDVDSLLKSLRRLHECHVNISVKYRTTHRRREWSGRLIQHLVIADKQTLGGCKRRVIRVTLDPKLGQFIGNDVTWVNVKDRAALRLHRMCAGLHAFYATHVEPKPYSLQRVRELLGIVVAGKDYERLLRAALTRLVEMQLIHSWCIENKQLTVTPKRTATKLWFLKKRGLTPTVQQISVPTPHAKSGATRPNGLRILLGRLRAGVTRLLAAINVGSRAASESQTPTN
jgi:hypothetical protein